MLTINEPPKFHTCQIAKFARLGESIQFYFLYIHIFFNYYNKKKCRVSPMNNLSKGLELHFAYNTQNNDWSTDQEAR